MNIEIAGIPLEVGIDIEFVGEPKVVDHSHYVYTMRVISKKAVKALEDATYSK